MNQRKTPRQKDTTSDITLTCSDGAAFHRLADTLKRTTALHHLNRVLLHFRLPDGRIETYTVWPTGTDEAAYRQRVDNLNWSEH